MNKKGFLKILEAIIAILLVFGFIITIIPEKPKSTAKLPPDLEQTIDSILKEMQESPEFRKCVLGGTSGYFNEGEEPGPSSSECVYNYIQFITRPEQLHPWNYAVRICKRDTAPEECKFHSLTNNLEDEPITYTEIENTIQFREQVLPQDKNVYIKSVSLSIHDILGEREAGEAVEEADEETVIDTGTLHVLTIFAWSKS